MSDYKPRTKKTAEVWVRLFVLANGRAPTENEIPFAEFEDMDQATDEWRETVAKLKVLFESSKEQHA